MLSAGRVFLWQSALYAAAQGVTWTMSTVYYVRVVGLDPLQLILVGTAMECACFLFQVPSGALADLYSRRGAVIWGTALSGIGIWLMLPWPSFAMVAVGLSLWGIGVTFVDGALQAWLAEEAGEAEAGRLFLRGAQWAQLGAIAGTAASAGAASVSLRLPLALGGAVSMALALWLAWGMAERRQGTRRPVGAGPWRERLVAALRDLRGPVTAGWAAVRASAVLPPLLLITAVAAAGSEGWDRLWEARLLRSFHFPPIAGLHPVAWFAVVALAAEGASALFLALLRGPLDRWGSGARSTGRTLAVLAAVGLAATLVFGLTGGFAVAVAAVVVQAVSRRIAAPLREGWLVRSVDAPARATVLSLCGQADALGQLTLGPVIGLVGTLAGLRAAMLAVAATLAPTLPLYLRAGGGRVAGRPWPADRDGRLPPDGTVPPT